MRVSYGLKTCSVTQIQDCRDLLQKHKFDVLFANLGVTLGHSGPNTSRNAECAEQQGLVLEQAMRSSTHEETSLNEVPDTMWA